MMSRNLDSAGIEVRSLLQGLANLGFHSCPAILILDEATNHLDPKSEEKVNSTVGARGMTRLIITHRPSSIDEADRIVEIKGGLAINSTSRATQ